MTAARRESDRTSQRPASSDSNHSGLTLPSDFMSKLSRRHVLAALGGAAIAHRVVAADDPWATHAQILKRIQAPKFPAKDFAVTKYGAKGDGKTDCSDAISKAIA